MAENQNAAPDEEYNDDGTKNPDYVDPNAPSESAGTDTTNGTDEDDAAGDDEGFDDTIDPTKPPEIPIRQSNAQFIIARKNDKIERLQSKLNKEEAEIPDEDTEEDNLTDDARGAIDKHVHKTLAPILGKLASEADETEIQELIKSDPEVSKYVNHIKAYMAHDAYKGVSPAVIYHHLAWSNAQALGAKKRKVADLEADQNKGGGRTFVDTNTSVDGLPTAQDIENMSDEDFARMEENALQGKFLK